LISFVTVLPAASVAENLTVIVFPAVCSPITVVVTSRNLLKLSFACTLNIAGVITSASLTILLPECVSVGTP